MFSTALVQVVLTLPAKIYNPLLFTCFAGFVYVYTNQ
jgi:hypothetical protein